MLRIRFFRTGKRNQPFFRIVVTDKKNPPRGGRFLEILGFFNPHTKEKNLKAERIKHWLSVGAQPSDRVHNLLVEEKIIEGEKTAVHAKAKKKKEEAVPAAQEKPSEQKPKEEEKKEEKPKESEKPASEEPKEEKKPEPPKQLEAKESPKLEAPEPEKTEEQPKEEKPK